MTFNCDLKVAETISQYGVYTNIWLCNYKIQFKKSKAYDRRVKYIYIIIYTYFFHSFPYNLFIFILVDIILLIIWLNCCFHLIDGPLFKLQFLFEKENAF